MKTRTIALVTCALALQIIPLRAQHTFAGNLTVEQDLSVGGNSFDFGTTSSSDSAVAWQYDDDGTNSTFSITATQPTASYLWRDNAVDTNNLVTKMKLDGTNVLSLFLPDGSAAGIVLNPAGNSSFSNSIVLGGTNNLMPNQILTGSNSILTRGLADDRYLQTGLSTLAVGGTNFVVSTNGRVGVGIGSPNYDVSLGGQTNRSIAVEQASTGSGKDLTISAGSSASGSHLDGGKLILAAGAATGIGLSEILFQTAQQGTNASATNPILTRMRINNWGAVGIGSGSLSGSSWASVGGLDVSWAGIPGTLMLGADINLTTRTDYTSKGMAITMPHYRTIEKPISVLRGWNHAGANELWMGGGLLLIWPQLNPCFLQGRIM